MEIIEHGNPWPMVRPMTGGRCGECNLAFRWPAGAAARVARAHCPRCGRLMRQTTLSNLKRIPILEESPWFRQEKAKRGMRTRYVRMLLGRYIAVQVSGEVPAFWYRVGLLGARLVRCYAPADCNAPVWLAEPVGRRGA